MGLCSADFAVPKRILCMTEESVETLYLLGREDLIYGVSAFVERPVEAKSKPVISTFTHAKIEKILQQKPDIVLGFSDIQKDIAKELIAAGVEVWIANHRNLEGVMDYVVRLGSLVNRRGPALALVEKWHQKIEILPKLSHGPKVYFEEWDEPMISAIGWVSELIRLCGGRDIFSQKSQGSLAKDRFVSVEEVKKSTPDIYLPCWCGKKYDSQAAKARLGEDFMNSVKVQECDPAIFLQPGPALFEAGLDLMSGYLNEK